MVGLRFTQINGLDLHEIYPPTAKFVILQCLLEVFVYNKGELFQLDITNAFLHGHHSKEVYISQTQGVHFLILI